ncbi:GNAT family N-acetyltransferase [Nocardia sp. NPDC058658]|uniref:GNAT family N-acetyltransferase n=1 Tax=Nocardia sp. NPDC058658 TaxID=3346580 RepID=UPI0036673B90
MSDWRIAPLTANRVTELAACHIASWREVYGTLVPAHILDGFDLDRSAITWERRRAEGTHRLPVALVDDRLIGFASATDSPISGQRGDTDAHLSALTDIATSGQRADAGAGQLFTDSSCRQARAGRPAAETELEALYVRSAWHGTGVADALIEAAAPGSPCTLWVFADYPRAHAFYRRHGFTDTGIHRADPFTLLPEQLWRRDPG